MLPAPIPKNEKERLCALFGLKLLDTASEERFDRITKAATKRFNVPISTITLVDEDREWYKSVQGLNVTGNPRETSFCGHALISEVTMVVEDTFLDARFSDNPLVKGEPHIRFYAGQSLFDRSSNLPVGVFCIKDYLPRKMSLQDMNDFMDLAKAAEDEINKKISP